MNINIKAMASATKNGAVAAAKKTYNATPKGVVEGVVSGSKVVAGKTVTAVKTVPKVRLVIHEISTDDIREAEANNNK